MDLHDPVATALLVSDALERAGQRYALFGGLLLAAYGEPRETHDADIAVVDLTSRTARPILEAVGLRCLPAFDGETFGGLSIDRLTLIGGDEHTGLNVLDLVRPRCSRYGTAALDRSVQVPLRDRSIRALTAEDFVTFKTLATRDRDLDDAASVLSRSRDFLDVDSIEREVAALAADIPDWDVLSRWSLIKARARKPGEAPP